MAITTVTAWARDGKPFIQCQPGVDLIATLRRHGYTGPGSGYPDDRHLLAQPPQDHCPYSNTPWPGEQPYPYCMALDIMPDPAFDWVQLGTKIVADKLAGVPGTECIKYMNWTDPNGQVWHDSWQPNHQRFSSTDSGHVHISWRTDFVTSRNMQFYDPLAVPAPPEEDDMKVAFLATQENPVYLWWLADDGPHWFSVKTLATYNNLKAMLPDVPTVAPHDADVQAGLYGTEAKDAPWPAPGPGPTPGNFSITFAGTGDATPTG